MNPIPSNIDVLSRLLDVASLRHRVVAHNIANVNTPGYHELDVSFENAFARAVDRGNLDKALQVRAGVGTADGGPERADGNNVDIDFEMARLNKNTLLYRVYTQVLAGYIAQARSAVTGR